MLPLYPSRVFQAILQESNTPDGVFLREQPVVADVVGVDEVHTFYPHPPLLSSSDHQLHIPVGNHFVSSGIQVQLWPASGVIKHGIIVIFVDVLGQGVKDHP